MFPQAPLPKQIHIFLLQLNIVLSLILLMIFLYLESFCFFSVLSDFRQTKIPDNLVWSNPSLIYILVEFVSCSTDLALTLIKGLAWTLLHHLPYGTLTVRRS